MCIANICTETLYINNFYDLVEMNLGQRGFWVADFPSSLHAKPTELRLFTVILVERPSQTQALHFSSYSYSSLIFFKQWETTQNVDNVKNIYHVNWFDQINLLIAFSVLFAKTTFDKAKASWQPLRVSTLNHVFLWCLVRDKRKQIKLSTCEEFLAQS